MAMPSAMESRPAYRRLRPGSAISNAVARIAASGGTLPARRAGKIAESTVTISPIMMVDVTVFCDTTSPLLGISILTARKSALRLTDNPIPATRPTMETTRVTKPGFKK